VPIIVAVGLGDPILALPAEGGEPQRTGVGLQLRPGASVCPLGKQGTFYWSPFLATMTNFYDCSQMGAQERYAGSTTMDGSRRGNDCSHHGDENFGRIEAIQTMQRRKKSASSISQRLKLQDPMIPLHAARNAAALNAL